MKARGRICEIGRFQATSDRAKDLWMSRVVNQKKVIEAGIGESGTEKLVPE